MASSYHIDRRPAYGIGTGTVLSIGSRDDVVVARERGRAFGAALGFEAADLMVIVTAISELAHNIVDHATRGAIVLEGVQKAGRAGIEIVAADDGLEMAEVGWPVGATARSRPVSAFDLKGMRSLMDEFEIDDEPRQGTVVTVRKWLPVTV
jgi:serine/threonine-protein kinase RsbT